MSISPLFKWPNSVNHYSTGYAVLTRQTQRRQGAEREMAERWSGVFRGNGFGLI